MRHFPAMSAALLFALLTSAARAEIRWENNLRTAHAQAQQEGKLLLLHFYSDDCVWCDRLEAGAFQAPEVAEAIHRNYVPVKINASQNPAVAKTFRVTAYPTDVIVTTEGTALAHTTSPQAPDRYLAMLSQHNPPAVDPTLVADQGAAVAGMQAAPGAGEDALPAGSAAPGAGAPSTQTAGTPAKTVSHRSPATPTAKSLSKTTPPKLALDGFCTVSLIEKNEWVEGEPEFGVIHLGNLYLFVDEAAMEKFLADPEPFTPVLNGIDVVRFFEEKKVVPGKRDFGVKDPDYNRLFFFSDEAAMVHFENQHSRYTEAAIAVTRQAVADANPRR